MRRTLAVLGGSILLVALAACSGTDALPRPQASATSAAGTDTRSPADGSTAQPAETPYAASTASGAGAVSGPAGSSSAPSPDPGGGYLVFAMPANCAAVASQRILTLWYARYPYAQFWPSVFPTSDVPSLAPDGIACSWGVDGLGRSWLTLSAAAADQYDQSVVYATLEGEGYTRTDLGDETYFTREGDVPSEASADDGLGIGAGVALFTPLAWFQASTTTGGSDLVQILATMTHDMRDRLHGVTPLAP